MAGGADNEDMGLVSGQARARQWRGVAIAAVMLLVACAPAGEAPTEDATTVASPAGSPTPASPEAATAARSLHLIGCDPVDPEVEIVCEAYDLVLKDIPYGLDFYVALAREAAGPVLDIACGTGRILLPCLQAGVDIEGLDLFEPMLKTLRTKAAAQGLTPVLHRADMSDFSLERRFALRVGHREQHFTGDRHHVGHHHDREHDARREHRGAVDRALEERQEAERVAEEGKRRLP